MIKLEPFYIHVTPEESEIVQNLLFKCGYFWSNRPHKMLKHLDKPYLKIENSLSILSNDGNSFCVGVRIITLEELILEIESNLTNINE